MSPSAEEPVVHCPRKREPRGGLFSVEAILRDHCSKSEETDTPFCWANRLTLATTSSSTVKVSFVFIYTYLVISTRVMSIPKVAGEWALKGIQPITCKSGVSESGRTDLSTLFSHQLFDGKVDMGYQLVFRRLLGIISVSFKRMDLFALLKKLGPAPH